MEFWPSLGSDGCGSRSRHLDLCRHPTFSLHPSSSKAVKFAARQDNRLLRTYFGAPAPLRSRSDWAGTWTGVACTSDFGSKQLRKDWPPDLWNSGRVLATQHQIGLHSVTAPRPSPMVIPDWLQFVGTSSLALMSLSTSIFGWQSAQDMAGMRWGHQ